MWFLPYLYCEEPCHKAGRRTIGRKYSSSCSSPRKSLVKGARFVRAEGKPELALNCSDRKVVQCEAANHVGSNGTIFKYQLECMRIGHAKFSLNHDVEFYVNMGSRIWWKIKIERHVKPISFSLMVEHSFGVWKKPMKNMWIYHGKFHWIFMGFNFIVLVTKRAGFFGGKKGLKFSFN